MKIPDTYNVYGYITSHESLEELASIIRRRLVSEENEVVVTKLLIDSKQALQIKSPLFEYEITKYNNEGKYSLKGAVAGNKEEICNIVKEVYEILAQHHYKPKIEVYDSNFNCIEEYNA